MRDGKGQDRNARIGLTRPAAGRLDLKKAGETSTVRQSFSHGRSKAVAVEVKKTRPMMPAGGGGEKAGPDEAGGRPRKAAAAARQHDGRRRRDGQAGRRAADRAARRAR